MKTHIDSNNLSSNIAAHCRGRLSFQEPLADYTSWRVGGVAECLYLPADLSDLSSFLQALPKEMPLTWLGLGSNTLVRDGGIDGMVIVTQGGLNSLSLVKPHVIRAEAGVASAQLARYSARQGLNGLAFLAGIPGTVGGALAMNAGCFGGETWQRVESVEIINRAGEIKKRSANEFEIAYRHINRFPDEWFVAGHFLLMEDEKENVLQQIRTLLEKRNATQPTGTANCGSVFRNPVGDFAGRLIEACGLKGKTIGGASVSLKHANFIINENQATSTDIENLIYEVQAIVRQKTSIQLVPEVCIIGNVV